MEEQELDLLLNKTTKIVLRGYPGRSAVLEIQRTVNNSQHGHGWSVESQAFLDEIHIVTLRSALSALIQLPEQSAPEEVHP